MADPLTIGMLAFSALSAGVQSRQASNAENASVAAAMENMARQDAELSRQQEERNRTAAEEKSDRQRAFDKDLAMVRVAAAEGFAMADRMAGEVSFIGGLDLARLESNRVADIASLQASKVAARQGARNTITDARLRGKAARTGAVLGSIGSGLQIGANAVEKRAKREAERNRIP